MASVAAWLLVLFAAPAHSGPVPHGGAACSTDWDCALGGACTAGHCACDPWFTGRNCTLLNLARAKPHNGLRLPGHSTWGGHAVYDNATDTWVGFFSLIAGGCLLSAYRTNSKSVLAVAASPDGPFVLPNATHPDDV